MYSKFPGFSRDQNVTKASGMIVTWHFRSSCNARRDPISWNTKFPDHWKPSKIVFFKSHPGNIVHCITYVEYIRRSSFYSFLTAWRALRRKKNLCQLICISDSSQGSTPLGGMRFAKHSRTSDNRFKKCNYAPLEWNGKNRNFRWLQF